MAPLKIDPVDTAFSVGTSLVGRVISFFASGWIGFLLGSLAVSFQDFSDLLEAGKIFVAQFSELSGYDALIFVFWPVAILFYMISIPFYGIPLAIIVATACIRIFFSEDPVLFWILTIVTPLSLGPVLSDGEYASWVVLGFLWIGLFAAMWWCVQNLHPEWVDWFRETFLEREEDEDEKSG